MKIIFLICISVFVCGCSSVPVDHTEIVIPEVKSPHLWSGHKKLKYSANLCSVKGESILKSLGFKSVVKNSNNVYGKFNDNTAAIKCVPNGDGSFVYTAVAGPIRDIVERLRNEIVWKL